MDLYERVKEICAEKALSVPELERRAGLPRGTIRKWNVHSPGIIAVKKVVDALGLASIDELLNRRMKEARKE